MRRAKTLETTATKALPPQHQLSSHKNRTRKLIDSFRRKRKKTRNNQDVQRFVRITRAQTQRTHTTNMSIALSHQL